MIFFQGRELNRFTFQIKSETALFLIPLHAFAGPFWWAMVKLLAKSTIRTRILAATLAPMLVVLALSSFSIYKVVKAKSEKCGIEATRNFAEQLSSRVSDQLSRMHGMAMFTKTSLENLHKNDAAALSAADNLLKSMLLSVPEIHNAWFAFEPGAFPGHPEYADKRFKKSYVLGEGNKIREIFDLPDEVLDNPEKSPWFAIPLTASEPYMEQAAYYNYQDGEGTVMISSLNYPLERDGKVIGVLGLDLVFKKVLDFVKATERMHGIRSSSLMTREGLLVYSTDPEQWEDPGAGAVLVPENKRKEALDSDFALVYEAVSPKTGESRVISLTKVEVREGSDPLLLYIELPGDALTRQAEALLKIVLGIGSLGVILIVVCIAVATRTIVLPLRRITLKAREIASGNLDVQFEEPCGEDDKNEITQLNLALKEMLVQLNQMHGLKIAGMTAEVEQQKMREAAGMKDRFFASMSHEIRTPMNAVIGLSDLLLTSELDEIQRNHVENVRTSAQALLSLINDILDTSKMEAGKTELVGGDYRFIELIDNVFSVVKMMADKKGLDFDLEISGELPACLFGDENRVRQVLLNLLGNAIKYTPKGFVRFSIAIHEKTIDFEVADSGIGIKEEVLPYVFDAFCRVNDSRTRKIEGTGLGLNIVRMLVEKMGGTIDVESVYGQGSVFRVSMPKVLGDPVKLEHDSAVRQARYNWKARVLVVDDNEINLTVATSLLEHLGISCEEAHSGEQAIELARETRYDLIFMDHIMPGMDGIEATKLLRASGRHNKDVPIIALTANAQSKAHSLFLLAGMNDILAKPIDISMMQSILYKWLPESTRTERSG